MGKGKERNMLCKCGSNEKYKHCCIEVDKMVVHLQDDDNFVNDLKPGAGRPLIDGFFQDKRVVAIGPQAASIPPGITFDEFLLGNLERFLGVDWLKAEHAKPIDEAHPVATWFNDYPRNLRDSKAKQEGEELFSVEPSGYVKALVSFAYDVYIVQHCAVIPKDILDELLLIEHFFTRKYEITMAAIFAKSGFRISWLPKNKLGMCEFIAFNVATKDVVIAEAKCRNWHGNSGDAQPNTTKTNILKNIKKASKKPTHGLPFFIFMDINQPLSNLPNPFDAPWIKSGQRELSNPVLGNTEDNPSRFACVFLTNYGWHHEKEGSGMIPAETLSVIPKYATIQPEWAATWEILMSVVKSQGNTPGLFPDQKKGT